MVHWYCESCERIWRYPIPTCPHCMKPIGQRQSSKKTILHQVTCSVPSTEHPNVPYDLVQYRDEYGIRWLEKSAIVVGEGEAEHDEHEAGHAKATVVTQQLKYSGLEFFHALWQVLEQANTMTPRQDDFTQVLFVPQFNPPAGEKKAQPHLGTCTNPWLVGEAVTFFRKTLPHAQLVITNPADDQDQHRVAKNAFAALGNENSISNITLEHWEQDEHAIVLFFPIVALHSFEKEVSVYAPSSSGEVNEKNSTETKRAPIPWKGWKKRISSLLPSSVISCTVADGTIGYKLGKPGFWNIAVGGMQDEGVWASAYAACTI